jgi:DNA-binding CsgD family transcriptional regulator/pimeloyl-ACP methyl ester carboxylesterase
VELTIAQGNLRSLFHASLLEHAKRGRALDAISDGWELLDFRANDHVTDNELAVWGQVADHSAQLPATSSQAAPGSFATAVLSQRGAILSVDANFALWLGSAQMAVTLKEIRDIARLARGGRAARGLIADRYGRPIFVVGLERHVGLLWPLSEPTKTALSTDEHAICLVAFAPTRSDTLQTSIKTVFSLTPSESKLAISLLNHDSLEDAAEVIGITEATANGYRKSLFKKMGVKRRSEMVQMILEIGYRERGGDTQSISIALKEMFGLSQDQMLILDQLALGSTTPQAAEALKMNIHTARDHVRKMFERVGVNKQSELVRVALEYGALVTLSEASEITPNSISDLLSNTRVIARPTGGLVYLGDYGAKDGLPIVLFHGGLGSRRIVMNFLRDAARANLRIISIERPGFGGTDLRDEPGFEGSSHDTALVLDKLGIEKAVVASIAGGNIAALSFAATYPSYVNAGLLLNPTLPRGYTLSKNSPDTGFRQMILSNPKIIRAMAKAFRNQMRTDLLDKLMDKYFSLCEADRLAMAIPEVKAVQRAGTQASIARTIEGFVREEEAFALNWSIPDLICGPWTIAVGLDDHTCDENAARHAWKDLPGFQFLGVHNAGRMIMASRSQMIVDTLVALARGKAMPLDEEASFVAKSAA